ncbi:MAG: hypothetical protein AB7D92_07840 [Sphaerochaeta sp.]
MKNVRVLVIIGLLLFSISSLSAAQHLSVPVDHRVYQVLDVAQIRGLIEKQIAVRPYSADKVLTLLSEIAAQKDALNTEEQAEIASLQAQLQTTYGTEPSSLDEVFSKGYFRTYDEAKKLGASLGVTLQTQQTVNIASKEYDSRNTILAYLRGDIGEHISYNMDFGLNVDKLNSEVFIPTEFTIPGEGFYMQLLSGGSQLRSIPAESFYTGLSLSPELSGSFFDGALHLRWGSIKRDWGPGLNNLILSTDARTFDGVDIQVDLSPWLRYSVITGSLGKFSLKELDDEPFFSDDYQRDKPYYRFDNNFSAHRVELDVGTSLTLSIFESTVWQKRFELGYLNPLAIYMFQQNNLGDIDDVFAGLDFSYTLPNMARFYGAMGMNEMNVVGNPITMLKAPRNMFVFQAGFVTPIPVGSFSSLTVQWTYVGPFVYSHYPILEKTGVLEDLADDADGTNDTTVTDFENTYEVKKVGSDKILYKNYDSDDDYDWKIDVSDNATVDEYISPDGRTVIEQEDDGKWHIYETASETAYVNKGENLGYPLDPNSQEFLVQLDLGLPRGWTAQLQGKYQVRSGQYGFSIEQFMEYDDDDEYGQKDFWGNVFKKTLSVQVKASKKLADMPIELSGSYRLITVWERPIIGEVSYDGRDTNFGPWNDGNHSHIVQVGAKIFF